MYGRTAAPLDPEAQRRHKLKNLIQSLLLLGGMGGLFALCGWLLLGFEGLVWIVGGAALGLAFSPRLSPRMILSLYRARELPPALFPEGHEVVRRLAARAGLERPPRLYYLPSRMLNAFAVGNRSDSAIAVTDGLMRALTLRELAGVLAHEMSHVRNNDLWIMNLADAISRLTMVMSYVGMILLLVSLPLALIGLATVPWLLVLLLAFSPTIAALLQLALSRAREFDADLDAAGLTRDPAGLASALRKLELAQGGGLWERILLPGRRVPDPSLLRSHPPTEERIRRLHALQAPGAPPDYAERPPEIPGELVRILQRPRYRLPGIWY